jgi:hypothetical protein
MDHDDNAVSVLCAGCESEVDEAHLHFHMNRRTVELTGGARWVRRKASMAVNRVRGRRRPGG